MNIIKTLSRALIVAVICVQIAAAQPGSTPMPARLDDPLYRQLRTLSQSTAAFSGDYANVENLVLKKDAAVLTLRSGSIYFLKTAEGRTVGGVFLGSGEFSLTPPTVNERDHLALFTDTQGVKVDVDEFVMFFTDDTFEVIKAAPTAKMASGGPLIEKARSLFRDRESIFRNSLKFNITSRTLADLYAPGRKGFFTVFVKGQRYGTLVYGVDPLGHAETYPEQVMLQNYGIGSEGIWTAFLSEDGRKRPATMPRVYDIKNHSIDGEVNGTRLIVKDVVTLEMQEAGARFLPFDLYRTLRVKSVKNEAGESIPFVQENKDEDSDLGVILPSAIEPGKRFTLTFEYDGVDALKEAGKGNFILIPRSTWYPNNPYGAFGDRATFSTRFRLPKKFVFVGTGDHTGEDKIEGDHKVSEWSSGETELAVAGFNYGDFKEKDLPDAATGLSLEVYTNKELPDEIKEFQMYVENAQKAGWITSTTLGSLNTGGMADTVLNEAQNATRIYTGFFGKLPYKHVAMTQQPAGFFGQAWPSLVYMPYIAFFGDTHRQQIFGIQGGSDRFWREVAAHEVAHQWWGHTIGWKSYRDQWMSEGFAEFSTSLYIQHVKKDTNKFIDFWEDQRRRIVEASPATKGRKPYTVGPLTQGYRLNSERTGAVAQFLIYPKGAYVLHMLRMMMFDHRGGTGDMNFLRMMRDFVTTNYNRDVSTEDFKAIAEKHMLAGMDVQKNGKLDWFFNEWVYGTEMPSYRMTYSISEEGGKVLLSGRVSQAGVKDNFVMMVPIYADYGKGWAYLGTARMVGNQTAELKGIPLPSAPKKVTVAALHDVLADKIDVSRQ
jgi:hypothetical protein